MRGRRADRGEARQGRTQMPSPAQSGQREMPKPAQRAHGRRPRRRTKRPRRVCGAERRRAREVITTPPSRPPMAAPGRMPIWRDRGHVGMDMVGGGGAADACGWCGGGGRREVAAGDGGGCRMRVRGSWREWRALREILDFGQFSVVIPWTSGQGGNAWGECMGGMHGGNACRHAVFAATMLLYRTEDRHSCVLFEASDQRCRALKGMLPLGTVLVPLQQAT